MIRHPLSDRPTLYVNPEFTAGCEGWSAQESAPLLQFLHAHATRSEFTCRFRWRQGSLAIRDNRATWLCALNDYYGARRMMHRITLEGEALQAAAA